MIPQALLFFCLMTSFNVLGQNPRTLLNQTVEKYKSLKTYSDSGYYTISYLENDLIIPVRIKQGEFKTKMDRNTGKWYFALKDVKPYITRQSLLQRRSYQDSIKLSVFYNDDLKIEEDKNINKISGIYFEGICLEVCPLFFSEEMNYNPFSGYIDTIFQLSDALLEDSECYRIGIKTRAYYDPGIGPEQRLDTDPIRNISDFRIDSKKVYWIEKNTYLIRKIEISRFSPRSKTLREIFFNPKSVL